MYGWLCKIVMATLPHSKFYYEYAYYINEVIIKSVCHLQEHLDLVH